MANNQGRIRAVMAWSSGKDGALALYRSHFQGEYEVCALLTTVAAKFGRLSIFGVREELVEKQVQAMRLPLHKIPIPVPCSDTEYDSAWEKALSTWKSRGIEHVIFEDIFAEDIRLSREEQVARLGMKAVFPLWGEDTEALSREIVETGVESLVVSIDTKKLPPEFAGRAYDSDFLRALPPGVDPCGENGEFHTFVFQAPFFSQPVKVEKGDCVSLSGFCFADLKALDDEKPLPA